MHAIRPHRSLVVLASLALLGLLATAARADEEGGIAIGDGRLHPFLDIQSRYDTFAALTAQGQPAGDLLWDIRPGLKLNVPSPTFSIDGSGDADFVLYTFNPGYDRILGDGQLVFGINRGGAVSFDLGDTFSRSDNNANVALPFAVNSDFNDLGGKLAIRPGGGALSIEPSYDLILEFFDPLGGSGTGANSGFQNCASGNPLCNPTLVPDMNFYEQKASMVLSWRFLPKTALLLAGDFYNVSYFTLGSGGTANVPLDIVDATLGLAGLITPHVELVAKAGYAQTVLFPSDLISVPGLATVGNDHTFVGQLQLGYLLSETGSIKIGVVRQLQPIPTVLAYYTDTRPYLSVHVLLAGKLTLHLDTSFDIFNYALDSSGDPAGRQDTSFRVDVGPEYEIARWLRVAVGYDFTNLSSSDAAAFGYPTASVFGGAGFSNNEVYARLTLTY
ncbi:MAG: hypothetical protein ACYCWW_17270 [Deltaproteobacteria bacterium]